MKKLKQSTMKAYSFSQLRRHLERYTDFHYKSHYRIIAFTPYSIDIFIFDDDHNCYLWLYKCNNKKELADFILEFIY